MKFIFFVFFSVLLSACSDGALVGQDAWIRTPAPGAKTAAAYFSITNASNSTVTLTGARCEGFAKTMIHKTVSENDMTRMIAATPLVIEAGARVDFKPGGLHVMLLQPQWAIAEGEQLELQLFFESQPPVSVLAEVRTSAP